MEKNANPEMQKIADKIKNIKNGMLVTIEEDGSLRSRPMRYLQISGTDILFLTGYASGKTHEIKNDSHVNVSFADDSSNVYVSISGKATVSKDPKKIEELWHPAFKAWFPEGKDDPNVAVLRVAVNSAEYWDSSSGPVVHAIGFAKAILTGEAYHPGDNEKLSIDK
ncbi:pyridoxamine 5'-phosphate oxidase family protein [Adhaeribacter aquaticus]|uniref:pyridoxamine 5'-phosphate oxidase family protein n=1 Tax=Adhaeribacter aquaticus TaxID=299567 RepID=UPI0003FE7437|nr:pyridoxamine 5'-phosphate oxidase family protein [Adhaeribacter aquaticus]